MKTLRTWYAFKITYPDHCFVEQFLASDPLIAFEIAKTNFSTTFNNLRVPAIEALFTVIKFN